MGYSFFHSVRFFFIIIVLNVSKAESGRGRSPAVSDATGFILNADLNTGISRNSLFGRTNDDYVIYLIAYAYCEY